MSSKSLIWIGMVIGSTVGSFIPSLWGAGFLSFSGMFFSAVGAILGIFAGYRIANS